MNFLFIHQNFPGQFRHLAPALAARGHTVCALGRKVNVDAQRGRVPGVRLYSYLEPAANKRIKSPMLARVVPPLNRAYVIARAARQLRDRGFVPDVVYAHIGWGEGIFIKDIFPSSKLLLYCEYYYSATGGDIGFDREFEPCRSESTPGEMRARLSNVPLLLGIEAADAGIAPTQWQRSRFPTPYQPKIRVIHDGIDTELARPAPKAVIKLPGKDLSLKAGDPVVTYVARNLEPYRGFHVFMRAVPEILKRNLAAQIVIVGGDGVSYSARLPAGQTYRGYAIRELGKRLDPERVHFIPSLPYDDYLSLLQVSAAHVYLTYPFVLSWSLLEALSVGVPVVASRTAPVEEVIRDGHNGLLVDFFSPHEVAERVTGILGDRKRYKGLREAARKTVCEQFDLKRVCLPQQIDFLETLSNP